MLNKLPKQLTKVSDYSVIGFLFLFPIFFLPFTYDVFELNKSLLVIVFAVWFLLLVGIQSIINKSLTITTSYLAFPISLFALSYLISGVFSISTTYSLWGFYGFLGNSLPVILATLSLVITIPSLVSSPYVVKKGFVALTISSFIVIISSFISFFQVIPVTRPTVFLSSLNANLTGGYIYFRYFLAIAAFVFSFAVLNVRRKSFEFFYFLGLLITFVTAALMLDVYYLLFVLVSAVLPLAILRTQLVKAKMGLVSLALVLFVVVAVVINIPQVATALNMESRVPKVANVGLMDSWTVSSRAFGQRPFFGYGPSTFISVFSYFKPQSMNSGLFWDTLFVKPASYYMLVLTETGLLGIAALAFVIYKLVRSLFTKYAKSDENYSNYVTALKGLSFLMLALLITTSGNIFLLGLLFIVLALTVSFEKFVSGSGVEEMSLNITGELSKRNQTSSLISAMVKVFSLYKVYVTVVVLVLLFSLNFVYRVFASDFMFLSMFNTPKTLLDARNNYIAASKIHPRNDFYHKNIIQLDRAIASVLLNDLAKKKDAKKEDKDSTVKNVSTLYNDATARANYLTSNDTGLNINSQNWEVKGLVYQSLLGLSQNADVSALEAYAQAAARNPLNPRILASAGNVYFFQKKYQEASNVFYKAVLLKPDYAVPRYNLAKSLEQLKQYDNAITSAKSVLNIVKKDSEDYKTVEKYISDLEAEKAKNASSDTSSKDQIKLDEANPSKVNKEAQPKLTEPGQVLEEGKAPVSNESPVTAPTPLTKSSLPNQSPTKPGDKGFIEQPASDVTPSVTKTATPVPTK